MKKLTLFALVLAAGCSTTKYGDFKRTSFLAGPEIQHAEFMKFAPDGTFEAGSVDGYKSGEVESGHAFLNTAATVGIALLTHGAGAPVTAAAGSGIAGGSLAELAQRWLDSLKDKPSDDSPRPDAQPPANPEAPPVPDVESPSPEPEQPAPIIEGAYRWQGFPKFVWDFERKGWPVTTVGGKPCDGLILLDGTKVEWVGAGRKHGSVVNATRPNDHKYYRPHLKPGQIVTIQVVSIDQKIKGPIGKLPWGG